jgi:hypothetical protein
MCSTDTPTRQEDAEVMLASLFAKHLNVAVAPEELGKFIRDHWGKVSPLAHVIHGPESSLPQRIGWNPDQEHGGWQ